MQVYRQIPSLKEPTAVALGFFDGIHLGHDAVLQSVLDEKDLLSVVFTFQGCGELPPAKQNQQRLFSDLDKHRFLDKKGIGLVISVPFSSVRQMDGETFVRSILLKKLLAKRIVCGSNFRFGKNASMDVNDLQTIADKYGVEVLVANPVYHRGEPISSSRVRSALLAGKIQEANAMLGRPYSITGEVIHGSEIGRTIGFPTINQTFFENQLIPKYGVYASAVEWEGNRYAGVTNIGRKPTVQWKGAPLAETHILSLEGDFYGQTMTVYLLDYLREEKPFSSLKALQQAIETDCLNAKKVCAKGFF